MGIYTTVLHFCRSFTGKLQRASVFFSYAYCSFQLSTLTLKTYYISSCLLAFAPIFLCLAFTTAKEKYHQNSKGKVSNFFSSPRQQDPSYSFLVITFPYTLYCQWALICSVWGNLSCLHRYCPKIEYIAYRGFCFYISWLSFKSWYIWAQFPGDHILFIHASVTHVYW